MGMQMTTIEVDQNTAQLLQTLKAKADRQGVTLDELLKPLVEEEKVNGEAAPPPRNEAMLEALRKTRERLKDMPVRGSTEETLKMIRAARGGEMWGYEPTDTE